MPGSVDRRGGRGRDRPVQPYPRTARVNALIIQVVADELERIGEKDDRLGFLTVTDVSTDRDFRRAMVYFATLSPEVAEVLGEYRRALQAAIGRSVKLKNTPLLQFLPDPAVAAGAKIEEVLRRIQSADDSQ